MVSNVANHQHLQGWTATVSSRKCEINKGKRVYLH